MKKQTHSSEIISAIEQKYPDIEVIDTITEGLSGAVVLLGHIHSSRSAGYQGIAFIKVDTQDRCQQEYNSHQHAQNPCNKEYIPSILTQPEPLFDDKYMIRYEPAHHVNLSARSLGNLIEANDLTVAFMSGQIHNLLGNVLSCWQHPHDLIQNRHTESVSNLLQILFNIGGKDRTSDLQDRADLWGLPGQNDRLLTFRPGTNIELPNPIAYILDASLWTNVQRIAIPTTAMHGDLHGGNIICDVNDEHSTPWLIDFAVFINDGMPFFDLAYLELDTLLRSLPSTSQGSESAWKDWVILTEFITGEMLLPAGEPSRRNTLPAWQLIKPIREHIHAILKHVEPHPGLKHDFEIAWWCAMVVVGTLFTRRSRVRDREYRIVSLLFAARSLDRLIQLTGAPKEENIAAEVWWREPPYQGSPFPGLKAFTPDQAPIFYGRTREIKELAGIIEKEDLRFLLVAGASGSGKSSLVDAGLIPHLKRHPVHNSNHWHRVRFTPDEDPFASMRAALIEVFPGEKQLASRIRENPSVLDELCEKHLGNHSEILLFVDQFEELFTLATESTIEPFVQFLAQVPMMKRVRAIATMRNDFYPNCFKYPDLLSLIQRRDYKLGAPGYRALHEMIKRPADKANVTFDDGLIDKILEETGTDPGALALMAYTMEKLYKAAGRRNHITAQMYTDIGGVQGAIATQAQSTLEKLSTDAQKALYRVFRDLVSIEGGVAIRQRAHLKNFKAQAEIEFIKAFLSARLLMADRAEDGQPTLEVAHEALLRSWPLLADWIEDTQDDLRRLREVRNAVAEWKRQGKSEAYRWKHELLEPIYDMAKRMDIKFADPDFEEFLRPEADRLLEEFLKYNDAGIVGATYEQRKIADRLVEIGPPAVPAMLVAYKYSSGASARQLIEKAIPSFPREEMESHITQMLQSSNKAVVKIAEEYLVANPGLDLTKFVNQLWLRGQADKYRAYHLVRIAKMTPFLPKLVSELNTVALSDSERRIIVEIVSEFRPDDIAKCIADFKRIPRELVKHAPYEVVRQQFEQGEVDHILLNTYFQHLIDSGEFNQDTRVVEWLNLLTKHQHAEVKKTAYRVLETLGVSWSVAQRLLQSSSSNDQLRGIEIAVSNNYSQLVGIIERLAWKGNRDVRTAAKHAIGVLKYNRKKK